MFVSKTRGWLDSEKIFNLTWCAVCTIDEGTYGGWVSENFVAFTRLLPWYFSIIHYLPENTRYVQPDKPVEKWLKKEYAKCLNRAGISTKGSRSDLKERVLTVEQME